MALVQILVFIHVTAAIAWIGGAIMHMALVRQAKQDDDPGQVLKLVMMDLRLAHVVYIPGSVTVLLTGIAMMLAGGYSWGAPWVSVGLVIWVAAFLLGILFYMPQSKKLDEALVAGNPGTPEVQGIMDRLERVSHFELPVFLFAVFAMTTKFAF
jgi:uncharacterized membrane protein